MADDSPDLETYRQRAKEWLAANLEPKPAGQVPRPRGLDHKTVEGIAVERVIQRTLFDGGYAGITWPKEYGGQGLSREHLQVFTEEAAGYRLPDLGVAGGTTYGICAPTMIAHAAPEFLARHIPKILSGEELWVQFFSEPGAGSDLAGVTTRATKDGERWILSGSKVWSSGAYYADYGMCLARTDWDVPKHRGLTWFAVKIDAPGVTVQPIREINGTAEFCQEFFDDVELTDDDLIGEVNRGWSVAQTMLVYERGAGRDTPRPAPEARGLAPDLVALARRLGRQNEPAVRQLIARAHTNDFVAGELNSRIAALLRQRGNADAGIAAYGKLAQGTFLAERAKIGMQIGRGGALVWEPGDIDGQTPALNYLNGRVMAIAGGTNEMQRNGIGERVLGLPREPSYDTDVAFRDVARRAQEWSGKAPGKG